MALHKRVYIIQDQYATDTKVESSYGAKEAHARQLPGGKYVVSQTPESDGSSWKASQTTINVLLLTDSILVNYGAVE